MRLYDISRELTTAELFPGTPPVALIRECNMAQGDAFNLSALSASLHAGTHCDAPLHFVDGAADIAEMPLSRYIGRCYVMEVPAERLDARFFQDSLLSGTARLLLKGNGAGYLTPDAAEYLVRRGVVTIGTDALSVSRMEEDAAVHTTLMRAQIAIIETLDLSAVSEGWYTLFAPPVKIAGAEGAFCRAVLMEEE